MAFGLTNNGFVRKLESDIEQDIKDDQLAELQSDLNQLPTSVLGQLNGIFSDKLREIWELVEAVYRSQYPDTATGEALDNVCSITGAFRLAAQASVVNLEVNIDAGVTLAVGRLVSSPTTNVQFATTAAVTNPGPGAADLPVAAQAVNTGPIAAVAGTITNIDTPQAGWNTVTNPLDATPGRDRETDAAFRLRREQLLRLPGAGTFGAVRSNIVNVSGVTQIVLFSNDTDFTDALGLPPHSFEAVIQGGDSADIAQTILDVKPVGIQTFGSTSDVATDSQGDNVTVFFSRPTTLDIYVEVTVAINALDYPADGDDQIKAAVVALGDSLEVGEDVIYSRFLCTPFAVNGVVDIQSFTTGTAPSPTGTVNIVTSPRELAVFDTSRVTVTTVAA